MLLIKDGFDYGFTSDFAGRLDAKWDAAFNGGGGNLIYARATGGRFGGGAIENNNFAGSGSFSRAVVAHSLDVPLTTDNVIFMGYSWFVAGLATGSGAGNGQELVGVSAQPMVANGWQHNAHVFVRVKNDASGHFWEVCVGDTSTGIPIVLGTYNATTTLGIAPNVWQWIEWEIKCHATTGYVKLRVDGVEKISIAAANTLNNDQPTTVNWIGPCALQSAGFFGTYQRWDDIHIWDNRGGGMDLAGGGKGKFISTLRPTANGFSNPGTPSAGSNYQCVDETFFGPFDGAGDFITNGAGNVELFNVSDGPGYTVIEDVTVTVVYFGTPEGIGGIKPTVRIGAANYAGTEVPIYAESVLRCAEFHWDDNPATVAAWVAADIAPIQVGYTIAI